MNRPLLFIEDTQEKARTVAAFIRESRPDLDLKVVQSFNSGWKSIKECAPPLVVMDMSLPTFELGVTESGARFRHYGGREILDRIVGREINTKVCILTQYSRFGEKRDTTLSQLEKQLFAKYASCLLAVIHYDSATDEWKARLLRVLNKAYAQ